MIVTEIVPTIVTFEEIQSQCRIEGDTEQTYLEGVAEAAIEALELETGVAVGLRDITIVYSADDFNCHNSRQQHIGNLPLPKGPISITEVSDETTTLAETDYEVRRKGKSWYLVLKKGLTAPVTVTAEAGSETIPALLRQAVLIHVESLWRNRGASTERQQYITEMGLRRIYELYDTNKALAG